MLIFQHIFVLSGPTGYLLYFHLILFRLLGGNIHWSQPSLSCTLFLLFTFLVLRLQWNKQQYCQLGPISAGFITKITDSRLNCYKVFCFPFIIFKRKDMIMRGLFLPFLQLSFYFQVVSGIENQYMMTVCWSCKTQTHSTGNPLEL